MKLVGRDIGSAIDDLAAQIFKRVRDEAARELRAELRAQDAISYVRWDDDAVVVQLHKGVPTHALPHIFAVALQHIRQRLDRYPDVRRPDGPQPESAVQLRQALRELVLEAEAESQLAPLALDQTWELQQRHNALKDLLREPPPEWRQAGSAGEQFMALQYARFELQHPPGMWEGLRKSFDERMPQAAALGRRIAPLVRESGWATPEACVQSLTDVRDLLALRAVAAVDDRRSGDLL
ncbi:MAG: hypothetical protein EXR65_03470 [Dehalococcoidia bacterium]|nr:hypothetical protein [Dehalococcoidia bacterium]